MAGLAGCFWMALGPLFRRTAVCCWAGSAVTAAYAFPPGVLKLGVGAGGGGTRGGWLLPRGVRRLLGGRRWLRRRRGWWHGDQWQRLADGRGALHGGLRRFGCGGHGRRAQLLPDILKQLLLLVSLRRADDQAGGLLDGPAQVGPLDGAHSSSLDKSADPFGVLLGHPD